MFTDENKTGGLEMNRYYTRLLLAVLLVTTLVAIKRLIVSLLQGKRTFNMYKTKLDRLKACSSILSKLATLSDEGHNRPTEIAGIDEDLLDEDSDEPMESEKMSPRERFQAAALKLKAKPSEEALFGGQEKTVPPEEHEAPNWIRFLDSWTEPSQSAPIKPTFRNLLDFRKAMNSIFGNYPFSTLFGPAGTREQCIESAQHVFVGLLRWTPRADVLPYETLLRIFESNNSAYGNMTGESKKEEEDRKLLSTLFRTQQDGKIRLLSFLQSVDTVYRRLRNFEAAVENSTSIDRVIESIVDFIFWLAMTFLFLHMEFGLDPWTIFLSCSTIIVSFSFALGPSIAATIQGIFTIVMRRPFDIGDRVHIADANTEFKIYPDGGWIVESLGLYCTTLRCASTGEVATISNGSMSNARIINFSRSPQANCIFRFRFGIETKHATINLFYKSVSLFIKNRPLQWDKILMFVCKEIEASMCYVEFIMVVSHVRSWSEFPIVMASKTELTQYCHDVMQKLKIQYMFPPVAPRYDDSTSCKREEPREKRTGFPAERERSSA